ncbi:MAG: EAL domain-containing protein, partial [Steroidobacteraceae bacterium]|nr:EAL domain-containing protein [Deltaproteobacteria bacterium]
VESLNPAAESMFGYLPDEMVGQTIGRIIPEIGSGRTGAPFDFSLAETGTGERLNFETVGRHKDQTCFPLELSISRLDLEGRLTFIAIIHNIAERKRAEAVLAEHNEFVESLVQNSAVPTFVLGPTHQVLIWNRACEELTGIRAEAMFGRDEPWKAFYDHRRPVLADIIIDGAMAQAPQYFDTFEKSSFIPEGVQAEGWYRNLNGMDRYILFNAAPIRNAKGELLAVIETLEDITERKRYEEQLEYQANHDGLTSLTNRNLLSDRIRQAMLMSRRNHNELAVFFVDLDNFKFINDSLGHDIGDMLLKIAAERLSGCVRSGDTVARRGGDEFVIVVSDQSVSDHATLIAGKMLELIAQPFRIDGHELVITCSIGISIFPRDGEDVQSLIKNADVAMYRAKEQGRNTFQFFTGEMNARSLARMTMEKYLRRALENDELLVYYQPKVSLATGLITSMEALVRWQHPEMGMVPPANFIPLAEETGLIETIGEWVLKTACAQNKAWQDAGLAPLTVAVNLSVRQFRQQNIAGLIGQLLLETGLDPRYLELEITESMVMQDVERVTAILKELKDMGISLAMDDFGTGYSSLGYLKRFPFDKLKIDQSFVRDITSDPDNAAIATAVIAMAHSLHLKVIAEGVETEGQLNYLRSHGCDEMQGYYFSRPVPALEFEQLLRENRHLQLAPDNGPSPEKTILVVDDEKNVGLALHRMLVLEGYRVLLADSAAEGFELLANNRVSVIISDQRMPVMIGTEFLSRVKELYPDTVRIILTGHADLNSITDAINRGAIYKFLNKPWNDDVIRETIDEAFKYHASLTLRWPNVRG